jgi:Ca2+-binding EF-hand superfamily protein
MDQFSVLQSYTLPADDPVVSQVIHNLESSDGAELSRSEVAQAIVKAAADNQAPVNNGQVKQIVERIFEGSELSSQGKMQRDQIRSALQHVSKDINSLVQGKPVY